VEEVGRAVIVEIGCVSREDLAAGSLRVRGGLIG